MMQQARDFLHHLFQSRSDRLAGMREEFTARFGGKRCLIVGSAPNAVAPDLARIDTCICVNGSPWIAARFGIDRPDLTVITGHKTMVRDRYDAVASVTRDVWRDLSTRMLLFIEFGDKAKHARSVFAEANFKYEIFINLHRKEYAAIIEEVCGREMAIGDSRISNGIFAAAVAMWAGAREVIFSGFSMEGGHGYIDHGTRRGHQRGDGRFFQLANNFACRVTTTSSELHRRFGLPLVT